MASSSSNHANHLIQFNRQATPSSPSPSTESTWSPYHPSLSHHHCIACHRSHRGNNVNSIAVMRSGLVLTGSNSTRIRAWRQLDCVDIGYIKASSSKVCSMLSLGDMLFTSHKDYKIRVWDIRVDHINNDRYTPRKVTSLPKSGLNFPSFSRGSTVNRHKDVISCMGYDHVEGILYTGSWDKSIKAWRVSEQKCIDSFVAHGDNINALVVNQEDHCLFTASSDGTVKIWRKAYGGCSHYLTMTLKLHLSPINALALSVLPSCSNILYSGSSDGCINFWVKEKHSCRYNHGGFLEGHLLAITCLMVIDNLVISGSEDTTIRVWRREEGRRAHVYHECMGVLEGHQGPVKCVNACLEMDNIDHKMLKALKIHSASLDQTFRVWRVGVSPETNNREDDDDHGGGSGGDWNGNPMEFEMSPVLSPLWVKK